MQAPAHENTNSTLDMTDMTDILVHSLYNILRREGGKGVGTLRGKHQSRFDLSDQCLVCPNLSLSLSLCRVSYVMLCTVMLCFEARRHQRECTVMYCYGGKRSYTVLHTFAIKRKHIWSCDLIGSCGR